MGESVDTEQALTSSRMDVYVDVDSNSRLSLKLSPTATACRLCSINHISWKLFYLSVKIKPSTEIMCHIYAQ